jgi:hypothetical protein
MVEGISVWETSNLPVETGDDRPPVDTDGVASIIIPITSRTATPTAATSINLLALHEIAHHIALRMGGSSVS